jgi:ABC-type Fe3+-hydroxamate transport system substrate-binding protein
VPEAAEILAAIGYGGEVRVVQGTEVLRRALDASRPDLVFASETAAGGGVPRREARRIVAAYRPRPAVYALEPHSLGDILSDVKTVGDAVGCQAGARALIEALRARIDAVSLRAAQVTVHTGPRRVACLLTTDPPVAAGWWQADLIGLAGGLDVLDGVGRPPRPTTWAEIERAGPELVVVLEATPPPAPPRCDGEGSKLPVLPLSIAMTRGSHEVEGPRAGCWRGLGGGVFPAASPGPGAVDLLERLAALLLPPVTSLR